MSAADAIAFARTAGAEPPDGGPTTAGTTRTASDEGPRGEASRALPTTSRRQRSHGDDEDPGDDDEDPGDGEDPGGGTGPGGGGRPGLGAGDHPALPEVTVPLVTLQGRAARAGENRLLGPLDPALARDLAAAAARSPYSRWEVTVVDDHGYASATASPAPGAAAGSSREPPGPAGCALPARINITVTETRLRQLASGSPRRRPRRAAALRRAAG